ncbi:uncharacterized protein LOC131620438 [Vicia villosa]|uniref:uncharacterized protein LOC131620438 n=1 Tax=Vicia villosa TaxID=3911 RepID=UPI00273B454E|nr:uncharacterized protein LOC131620438 [Vicia villosa]
MASSWFIKLAFKCLHHIAWPLFALVFPMCASIQAIETDSNAETKNLISYWILLSLIYLFEYAFIKLLLWFHLWQYIKLMIIFWLVTPDFGRAYYVYNSLIRSMKPQIVTCWRKCFPESDNFLVHGERYVKENGTEALEKLITSKTNGERVQIEQKDIKDLEAIEKKEILVQTNGEIQTENKDIKYLEAVEKKETSVQANEQIQTENKDIKDLEATEKTEIPAAKQITYANIVASQKASPVIVETKRTAESGIAGGEAVQSLICIEKEVQREWTCALCLVKVTCEKTLNSHLKGKKHRAACEEALKLKMPSSLPKKLTEPIRIVNSKIICKACNVMLPSDDCVVSHIKGWKHMSNLQIKSKSTKYARGQNLVSSAGVKFHLFCLSSRAMLNIETLSWFHVGCAACLLGSLVGSFVFLLSFHLPTKLVLLDYFIYSPRPTFDFPFTSSSYLCSCNKQPLTPLVSSMASSWFLKLAFKFLHHFAWPLVALLYPMCASIQAIETDSYAETKNLISYWILLSFIYLFEYAFINLLPWFQLWLYIKLMIIFWLTIPDFGRASYVYNNVILSMKLQIVTWRLSNYRTKWLFEKDNFLMRAEIYMNENGTEALEKLIVSKNTMCIPHIEGTNDILATDNKETSKTNVERVETNIKDLEAIVKKEIPANQRDISVISETVPSQNASTATVENKVTTENNIAGGEVPQSSTSTQKEVQKEWNCALCSVTTSNEITLNSHLSGRKHRAAIKTFIAKKLPTLQKLNYAEATNEITATESKETLKTNGKRLQPEQTEIKDLDAIAKEIPATKQRTSATTASQKASFAIIETKGTLERDTAGGEVSQSSTSTQKEVQKEWACALCLVTTSSETTLNSHLSGRKHMNTIEALKAKKQPTQAKKQPTLEKNLCEPFRMVNSKIICKVCNIMLPSEEYMASHIKGWKHLSKIQS